MADDSASETNPYDVQTIRQLVTLMSKHDLSEIHLKHGRSQLRLRRGAQFVAGSMPQPSPQFSVSTNAAPSEASSAKKEEPAKDYHLIKSPTPGTYYAQEKPGSDPFVKVGSRVTADTTVALIEAMKLYSPIQAECSGVIVSIEVENGQPVDYGTVLFKVDTTQ